LRVVTDHSGGVIPLDASCASEKGKERKERVKEKGIECVKEDRKANFRETLNHLLEMVGDSGGFQICVTLRGNH